MKMGDSGKNSLICMNMRQNWTGFFFFTFSEYKSLFDYYTLNCKVWKYNNMDNEYAYMVV